MKTAVVYYSMSGNTAYVAEKIAAVLDADRIELNPKTAYPEKGLRRFLKGGGSALKGDAPELEPYTFHAEEYDRIIFGMPVWASCVTPPLRTFLNEQKTTLAGKHIGLFVCYMGSGADKAITQFRKELGEIPVTETVALIDPKNRPTAEKETVIENFCKAFTRI